jgi:hypothetical protein
LLRKYEMVLAAMELLVQIGIQFSIQHIQYSIATSCNSSI